MARRRMNIRYQPDYMIGDKKRQEAFSLLEVVVGVGIFMFLLVMVFDLFQSSIMYQKNAIGAQQVQEGLRYAMELMSKEIRSATANINAASEECMYAQSLWVIGGNRVYNSDTADNVLYFRNRIGDCVYLSVTNKQLIMRKTNATEDISLPISSRDIEINDLRFDITDNALGAENKVQPSLTIAFRAVSRFDGANNLDIQTSISSRYYQ